MNCKRNKNPRKKTTCYLPIDIIEKIDALFKGRNREDAISLVNKIYSAKNYNREYGKYVSYTYYEKCLRRSANEGVFKTLRDNEILVKTKEECQLKGKAAWYKVNSIDHCKLIKVEYKEVFEITPPHLMDDLCRKVGLFMRDLADLAAHGHVGQIADNIIMERLDEDGYYNFPNGDRKNLSPYDLEIQRSRIIKKHSDLLKHIKEDHLQQRQPKRNDTNRRMNYTLTRLNSKYYTYLVWKAKEKIEESDLSNSQPILLTALLDGRFSDQLLRRLSCDNYPFQLVNFVLSNINTLYNNSNTYKSTIDSNNLVSNNLKREYLRRGSLVGVSTITSSSKQNTETLVESSFKALTKSSKLYQYICAEKGWDINKSEHKKRAKEYVFGCIYGSFSPRKEIGKNRRKFMQEYFPDILYTIDKLKKSFIPHFKKMKKENPEQYNRLALKDGKIRTISKMASNALSILLQRLESYLFIDQILKKCYKSNIPCAPKHDALLYPRSYKTRVENIMKKELDKYLGVGNYSI